MSQLGTRKSIFITCQGTRGDVQPYVNLGLALVEEGWSVMIGAPPEFRNFVNQAGLEFSDIGQAPTHTMYQVRPTARSQSHVHRNIKRKLIYASSPSIFLFCRSKQWLTTSQGRPTAHPCPNHSLPTPPPRSSSTPRTGSPSRRCGSGASLTDAAPCALTSSYWCSLPGAARQPFLPCWACQPG